MKEKIIKSLKIIEEDMKNDAKNFDGKIVTGELLTELFAHQGAAIAALAYILRGLLEAENV